MYAPQRQDVIAGEIQDQGGISVSELAERYSVSAETIRRDLDVLERQQRVTRVHGGAVPYRVHSGNENTIAARSSSSRDAKARIAAAAARHFPPTGGSVIVDSGTTTAVLSHHLAERPDLTVVTNSVLLAYHLSLEVPASVPHRLHLVGGRVRGITQSVVGADAVASLRGLRADVAFLGANGITPGFGFSTPDQAEAQTKYAMTEAARRRIALVDQAKLGEELLCSFATTADIDLLITDAPPDHPVITGLRHEGMDVIHT
ncbi:DeoR/GlpR family DNA-binding transcription regulator [Corynebacterium glyciniphilum]|uniref:DeoR/GlpR family DNA-binding transcription regulator n=1 Tax=Corynebacterium glyciniphilum TaxID=1404244 RepID=UPI00264B9BEA|nr:DeoR/GlpR family DNA-binding transcription regulator [Corynebacterium glyciniphilum]MDN6706547.1 DeoR/GlpR family DNA-binding transcription regulator [Corynebacterium glyciniphilum]